MSAHFKSAISRLRPTSERRARTTAVATLAAAQNGTSVALAERKHARRLAGLATPRTGSVRDTHSKQSAHSAALDERLNPCHRLSHRSWKPRPSMMPHLRKGGWGWFRSHVA